MRRWILSTLTAGGLAAAAVLLSAGPAAADRVAPDRAAPDRAEASGDHAVFVQTNAVSGNTIRSFARAPDGTLHPVATYPTGGRGGTEVGAPLDALASQGSLVYDAAHRLLLAVNAGSDSVTSFTVDGDHLRNRRVVGSGGAFPSSIAVSGGIAYVLDAGGDGAIQGFRLSRFGLVPLAGTNRSLHLGNANPPVFISAPAQVGISPDGRDLLVTTKNHNTIEVYGLDRAGRVATTPTVTPSANPVPFAFAFGRHGDVMVTEAGTSSLTDYAIGADGTLTARGSAPDNQAALCWVQPFGRYVYGANAGSSSISAFRVDRAGHVDLATETGVVATTNAGPIDMTTSGGYLYVQNSVAGTVTGYRAQPDGGLTLITTVTGLPAFAGTGMEGIAAN